MSNFVKALILGTASMALASAATAQERTVNVYNWSDYIDEEVLKEFTAETGIKVVYDVFDSNEVLETKLLAGGTGYDVVLWLEDQVALHGFDPPALRVHWANSAARARMEAGLASIARLVARRG